MRQNPEKRPAKTEMSSIRLVVGLGNPGPRYQDTRHNVGAALVARLATRFQIALKAESRFKGDLGRGQIAGVDVRLLNPTTFMNLSGESVGAVARFYQIAPEEILVAYDEMAFEPGVVKLKQGGGANGHNGILSVIASLGNSREFHRLRIGVGHPGDKNRVTAYLTSVRMPAGERTLVEDACEFPESIIEPLFSGQMQRAMNLYFPARCQLMLITL
jgi:PTH1 family peptidyl-tRNA hydrolase